MKKKSFIKVEYIESGTFQGGEEDVSKARIEYGEEVIVLKVDEFERLKDIEFRYNSCSK